MYGTVVFGEGLQLSPLSVS